MFFLSIFYASYKNRLFIAESTLFPRSVLFRRIQTSTKKIAIKYASCAFPMLEALLLASNVTVRPINYTV